MCVYVGEREEGRERKGGGGREAKGSRVGEGRGVI